MISQLTTIPNRESTVITVILERMISQRGEGAATTSSRVWPYRSRANNSLAMKNPICPTLISIGATSE